MPVRKVSVAELVLDPSYDSVCAAYEAECGRPFWGGYHPDVETYLWLEKNRRAICFGAFDHAGALAGFAILIKARNFAAGRDYSAVDFVFVRRDCRGELGGPLMSAVLHEGTTTGECLISAQVGSHLDSMLRKHGAFEPQETVYRYRRS